MAYLFYGRRTATTGRHLCQVLGIPGGTRGPADRVDIMIRWGASDNVANKPGRVINKRDAIRLATDKYQALLRMAQSHIPTPRVWGINEPNVIFPALGRRTNHAQGRDIVLCMQQVDLQRARDAGCTHLTGLIPKAREFRVHVFMNEVIKVSEKVQTDPAKYVPWVWNYETGFTFRNPRQLLDAVRRNIEAMGVVAMQAVGLDFGAADICIGDDGLVRVFEVNTGPSLAEKTLGVYAEKLAAHLGIEVNREALEALNNVEAEEEEAEEQAA